MLTRFNVKATVLNGDVYETLFQGLPIRSDTRFEGFTFESQQQPAFSVGLIPAPEPFDESDVADLLKAELMRLPTFSETVAFIREHFGSSELLFGEPGPSRSILFFHELVRAWNGQGRDKTNHITSFRQRQYEGDDESKISMFDPQGRISRMGYLPPYMIAGVFTN